MKYFSGHGRFFFPTILRGRGSDVGALVFLAVAKGSPIQRQKMNNPGEARIDGVMMMRSLLQESLREEDDRRRIMADRRSSAFVRNST